MATTETRFAHSPSGAKMVLRDRGGQPMLFLISGYRMYPHRAPTADEIAAIDAARIAAGKNPVSVSLPSIPVLPSIPAKLAAAAAAKSAARPALPRPVAPRPQGAKP